MINKIENQSDKSTRNCSILRANIQLLTWLKQDNNRKIIEDIGFIKKLDTSKCDDCDIDDLGNF